MSQKVLITGANGGFGKLTVHELVKQGHQVAASMRGIDGRNKEIADEFRAAGVKVVEIDVTDDGSVESGVAEAISQLGGLDVVVNNAGLGVIGFQEQFTPEDFRKVFDINVFGVQRVNRAAIPHLRKQGSGLLIHVSSLLGRIALPFYGPYNATKWALEAMSDNYRFELSAFGIESVLVEPGGFATGFMHALLKPSDNSRDAEYGDYQNAPQGMFDAFEGAMANNPAQDPQNVADAIAKVIGSPAGKRAVRTVVDNMGMGEHINPYNDGLGQIYGGIFNAFGMSDMLEVKPK